MKTKTEPAPIFDQDAEAAHAEPPLAPIQLDKPVPPMANTEFAYQPPAQFADPMLALLSRAVELHFSADELGKLVDLQERISKQKAEAAYWAAMSPCQKEMGPVYKNKTNKDRGNRYADFAQMVKIIKPIYTRYGFSLTFTEEPGAAEGKMRVVCDVGHEGGHHRRHMGDFSRAGVGLKGNPNMTAIEAEGATRSYGKRYLCKDIFNIAEADEDNDGADGGLSPEQVQTINEAVDAIRDAEAKATAAGKVFKAFDYPRWLKWATDGGDNLEGVPLKRYEFALDFLKQAVKAVSK